MQYKIISTDIVLPKELCDDNTLIERELAKQYGDIIRWAIVRSDSDTCKISVSYKEEI